MKNRNMPISMDDFLKPRLAKYQTWIEQEKIRYSSRIIPVNESIEGKQWVLPTNQILAILKKANTIALSDCICRSNYKRCTNPLNVCLLLNQYGQKHIKKGTARNISFEDATSVVKMANEKGLVHLSLYRPDQELYALCSCCPCCCHDLQLLLIYNKGQLIAHSDYVAATDMDQCVHCGECIQRCYFNARSIENENIFNNFEKCYGCGLCVTVCPVSAISMHQRE